MTALQRLQSLRRTATTSISLALINLAAAPPALADAGTLALASWINVADSHGVSVGSYGLSLNNGSLTNPTAGATSLITHWLYGPKAPMDPASVPNPPVDIVARA